MIQQAFVSEAFHPDDCVHNVWNDLMDRADRKARCLGGRLADVGPWLVTPPLEDEDDCFHVRLMFSVTLPEMQFHVAESFGHLILGEE